MNQDRLPNRYWFVRRDADGEIEIVDNRNVFVALITGEFFTPDDIERAQLIAASPRMLNDLLCASAMIGALRHWLPVNLQPEANLVLSFIHQTLSAATGERITEGAMETETNARESLYAACMEMTEAMLAESAASAIYLEKRKALQAGAEERELAVKENENGDQT